MESTRRRMPPWLWITLTAVVVAVVGAIGWFAFARPETPAPAPSASPTTAAPVGSYRVAVGEGGTSTASDGTTPIGYEQTCEGAVAAATNYTTGIQNALFQGQMTEDEFVALLEELNGGIDNGARTLDPASPLAALVTEFAQMRADAEDIDQAFDPEMQFHPEWGGFRVETCAAGAQATVDVVGYFDPYQAEGMVGGYGNFRTTVAWVGDDWRLIERAELDTDEVPEGALSPETAPVPAAERRAWISTAGPGWTEYTNAPQS